MNARNIVPMWLRYRVMDLRGRGVYDGVPNQHQCIFIHIPRTAGTSVELSLFGQGSRHVPYFEYEKANRWKFRRFFKFAFVRNPWDRLVSTYFFLRGGGLNEMDCRWAGENLAEYDSFDAFVKGWLTEERIWCWAHFKPQHHFICDEAHRVKVNFLGRFERIETDFTFVAKQLKRECQLVKINRSEHRPYSAYYTEETSSIVSRVYRQDIELFHYRFEGKMG